MGRKIGARRSTWGNQPLEKAALELARRRRVLPGANADDSSFLASVGYFRPATIFEGDSSRGFAAVLVRVCARWPAQRRRSPQHRRRGNAPTEKPVRRKIGHPPNNRYFLVEGYSTVNLFPFSLSIYLSLFPTRDRTPRSYKNLVEM